MKAEEWLTYFIKIYGRRPKMTEVDEAIQMAVSGQSSRSRELIVSI
ncbi:MAG: hypothetical protein ACLRPQ_05205 [Streptococcus sp.]